MGRKKDNISNTRYKLLVIRLSAMGDVAICVPVVLALTRKYPRLEITLLTKPTYGVFFEDIPNVYFHPAEVKGKHSGPRGLYRLFSELKKQKFDAVADLHGVIRSHVLSGFFRATGTPVFKIDKGRSAKKAITRPGNKKLTPLKTTAQRYADVFAKLGYPIDLSENFFLQIKELTEKTAPLFKSDPLKKHIGIAPFAAHKGKQYPLEQMLKVIAALDKPGKYNIFLFGGGIEETEILDKLAEDFEQVQNVARRFSLAEELGIISNLDAILAMDSGNGHLAAMYGVPVVTLWGVTHPYLGFVPYAQPEKNQLTADREKFPLIPTSVYGNKLPKGYENAMETIKPETIILQLKKIVGNK